MSDINNLDRLHKAELYLLVEFDKACRKSGLTYFLDSGTALGAIRHGGFIPWDDDIDVAMPRTDYERFMEIGQDMLPHNIFLQNRQTEKNYRRYAAKLRLDGTVFPETDDLPFEHNGIFIDLFPFDYLPNNRFLAKLDVKYVVELSHIIRANRNKTESDSPSKFRRVLDGFIKKIPSNWIDKLERHCVNHSKRYQNKPTKYVTCFFWRMSQTRQYLFASEKMFPVKDFIFDGHSVSIMKDPDYYLRLMYNDYMKLPPIEQRIAHCRGEVVFGVFETI